MKTIPGQSSVSEIQGLYGPLQILEGKVQQIWALQQIQRGAWQTRSGARLKVCHPGKWNHGAGPDFLEAVIELDGERRVGDVEFHLYREDWWRHGHHLDPAYDTVVLHAVLFAGGLDRDIRTSSGKLLEEWVMGPWLREDLESVAGGEPGLYGELAPELREWIESETPQQIRNRLGIGADRRWQDKESMARCLIREHGWTKGLHLMTLFYLGYPFNRRAFYAMGEALPPECWREPGLTEVLQREWETEVRWNVGRPANRALGRLEAYMALNQSVPDWFNRLSRLPLEFQPGSEFQPEAAVADWPTGWIRKHWKLREYGAWLRDGVFGGLFSQSLVDRLLVDVCLPMQVANGHISSAAGGGFWFHARPGMFPDSYRSLLKLAGIQLSSGYPLCNGWLQGLVWADDQLRLERIRSSIGETVPAKRCLTS
ncbi:DUF2851 family protein [Puniceicoccales bacterium CK1056]|uniref:DUF2851 family protein n=1 Tax=Oceanipulchritudo coccoides TaxID=2706888 RepID=A0A6B2LXX4_9BACT|nr:DUF2851 family protein [Oceanipulchritudo coccoides]NDV61163.1 DUF2851 family protein [Oceanipulchritudo coccoides]